MYFGKQILYPGQHNTQYQINVNETVLKRFDKYVATVFFVDSVCTYNLN